jgi:hypothetical protein
MNPSFFASAKVVLRLIISMLNFQFNTYSSKNKLQSGLKLYYLQKWNVFITFLSVPALSQSTQKEP